MRFTTATGLINELPKGCQHQPTQPRALGRWARLDLICIDELGDMPLAVTACESMFQVISIRSTKGEVNPRVLQSVRVTARHHALAGQVVRVVRRKRHRGEAYVVVEVEDGSRQLIAARNTELADRSSAPGLRFTPGSLRALLDVIDDLRRRLERADGAASAPADQPARLWTLFSPETRQQAVQLWTELLGRQLRRPDMTAPGTGAGDEHRAVSEPKAAASSLPPAGHRLRPAVDAATGAGEPGEHATPVPAGRTSATWAGRTPQVQVIDDDLGLSGASSHQRGGFQRLVAAIGLGEVGMVLVTEVSRLSRRNSDWHRVIELCAVFRTLIADEDGI